MTFQTKTQINICSIESRHRDVAELGSCDDCRFSAYHGATLDLHKKSMHRLKCELCDYEGASTKHIRTHVDKAHKQRRDPLKIEKQEPFCDNQGYSI